MSLQEWFINGVDNATLSTSFMGAHDFQKTEVISRIKIDELPKPDVDSGNSLQEANMKH